MHTTTASHVSKFVAEFMGGYVGKECKILLLGSGEYRTTVHKAHADTDLPQTLRSFFHGQGEQLWKCVGADIEAGNGVDVVLEWGELPFVDEAFDVIVSVDYLDRDCMFWITFQELCRVLRPAGFMHVSICCAGPRDPLFPQIWNWTEDAWRGLQQWAKKHCSQYMVSGIQSFGVTSELDARRDSVSTWTKGLAALV